MIFEARLKMYTRKMPNSVFAQLYHHAAYKFAKCGDSAQTLNYSHLFKPPRGA